MEVVEPAPEAWWIGATRPSRCETIGLEEVNLVPAKGE